MTAEIFEQIGPGQAAELEKLLVQIADLSAWLATNVTSQGRLLGSDLLEDVDPTLSTGAYIRISMLRDAIENLTLLAVRYGLKSIAEGVSRPQLFRCLLTEHDLEPMVHEVWASEAFQWRLKEAAAPHTLMRWLIAGQRSASS